MKISILIPVYNEERTVFETVRKACAAPLPRAAQREVIVVDDGSTDGTSAELRRFSGDRKVRVLHLEKNLGKTKALIAGIKASSGTYLLFQDADLEYDPVYYESLLSPVVNGCASVVLGSRFLGSVRNMTPLNRFANRFSTWVVNRLYRSSLTDVNTGFKVLPRNFFEKVRLRSNRFGGDAEILARLLRKGQSVLEVPIHYVARAREDGKKMNWVEALYMFGCFLYFRFDRGPA